MISLTSLENRHLHFWLLNVAGWCCYFLLNYVPVLLIGEQWGMFWFRLSGAVICIIGSGLLREIYRRTLHWAMHYKVLLVLFCSSAFAIPLTLLTNLVLLNYYYNVNDYASSATPFRQYFVYFLHYFVWSGIYYGVVFYRDVAFLKQSELNARNLARDAQLKMLQYQLNPHFLFNTLNAISTLILLKETKPANEMVLRLSDFLRHTLENDPVKQVTLQQEITSLQLYLGIEKARFEERLNVEYIVEDDAFSALVPSLILQPFIENSIKYAISSSLHGGTITIAAKVFAKQLLIEIRDTGAVTVNEPAKPNSGSCGVGLANCQQRLAAIYDGDYSFSYGDISLDDGQRGFQVNLRVPFRTA